MYLNVNVPFNAAATVLIKTTSQTEKNEKNHFPVQLNQKAL